MWRRVIVWLKGPQQRRPLGVALFALYLILLAVYSLVSYLIFPALASSHITLKDVVERVVLAVIGYGLWALQPWARKLWLILTGAGIPIFIAMALFGTIDDIEKARAFKWFVFFYVLIAGVLWVYLTRPKVSAAFRKEAREVNRGTGYFSGRS